MTCVSPLALIMNFGLLGSMACANAEQLQQGGIGNAFTKTVQALRYFFRLDLQAFFAQSVSAGPRASTRNGGGRRHLTRCRCE
jgi:hypothetical protein